MYKVVKTNCSCNEFTLCKWLRHYRIPIVRILASQSHRKEATHLISPAVSQDLMTKTVDDFL